MRLATLAHLANTMTKIPLNIDTRSLARAIERSRRKIIAAQRESIQISITRALLRVRSESKPRL
jgi:hypothetical protein